jgi:hypothetical protein
MGSPPTGFSYAVQRHGEIVVIRHHGRVAATLRGGAAARFLTEVEHGEPQQLMARLTGNYKRGNERAGHTGQ